MTNALTPLDPTAQLPTTLTPLIDFATSSITGSDGQFDGVAITGAKIRPGARPEDLRAGLMAINRQCEPCGARFAAEQLALLKARTKSRADDNGKLQAAAYTDWLADFPPDVAKQACEEWARGMIFWPAWSELQLICDRLISGRLALRKALQEAIKTPNKPVYLGKREPETREERLRASINAFIRHGYHDRARATERMLAQERGRPAEDWAKEQPTEPNNLPAERPTFKPIVTASTAQLKALAEQFHRKQRGEGEAA